MASEVWAGKQTRFRDLCFFDMLTRLYPNRKTVWSSPLSRVSRDSAAVRSGCGALLCSKHRRSRLRLATFRTGVPVADAFSQPAYFPRCKWKTTGPPSHRIISVISLRQRRKSAAMQRRICSVGKAGQARLRGRWSIRKPKPIVSLTRQMMDSTHDVDGREDGSP